MKRTTVALVVSALVGCLLSACRAVTPTPCEPPATLATAPCCTVSEDPEIRLSEAACSVSRSLYELKALEKTTSRPVKRLPYPTAYGLGCMLASVDWSGPIEPLLRRVAKLAHYRLQVVGRVPSVPVLVTIVTQRAPLSYVIRNADVQAGSKASIFVYPGIRTIELRYAKNQF